jgi:hypothetical protein
MPYSTGRKVLDNDTVYQNKFKEIFPSTEVSSKRVPDLKLKQMNEMLKLEVTARVSGIDEREVGGGNRETFYILEIREMEVVDKDVEDMSSDEVQEKILARIEEEQE